MPHDLSGRSRADHEETRSGLRHNGLWEGDALLAVRILLGQIRSDDMPNRATRAQWRQIEETMLRLGTGVVPSDKIRGLGDEVRHLREAIVQHLALIQR